MKKFPFSLSWKLTLCSILMMLLMWAAVGVVLVLNTAEEIMAAQDDEAQRRADLVIQYGDVDMIGYYYRLCQGYHWIEESGRRRGEVLFPTENSSWPSRYSQYTVIRPISADHDSKTVWAETFLGIQVQGAPEGVDPAVLRSAAEVLTQLCLELCRRHPESQALFHCLAGELAQEMPAEKKPTTREKKPKAVKA